MVTNFQDNTVSILVGNGDGSFQPRVYYSTGLKPQFVCIGDFNKDGRLDLGVANTRDDSVSILLQVTTVATRIDGRGTIDNQGNEVPFKFHATQAGDSSTLGYFSFCDPAGGVCITKGKIGRLSFAGNTADFSGQDEASGLRFIVSATDNGEPGTLDTISISLRNGYSVSGTLITGDIRIQ